MTTIADTGNATIDDYKHPNWCDLKRCEPYRSGTDRPYGVHHSTGTAWGVQSDECEFSAGLVRGDDFRPHTDLNGAQTSIRITLRNSSFFGRCGTCTPLADAEITPAEARMLATILNKYADRCDNDADDPHGLYYDDASALR